MMFAYPPFRKLRFQMIDNTCKATENMDRFVGITFACSQINHLLGRDRSIDHSLAPSIDVLVVIPRKAQTEFFEESVARESNRVGKLPRKTPLGHSYAHEREVFIPITRRRQTELLRTTFQPADEVQLHLVECMAGSRWRLTRALNRERLMHDLAMGTTGDPVQDYYQSLLAMDTPEFHAIRRAQAQLELSFQRTLKSLALIRKEFPAQPQTEEIEQEQPAPPQDVKPEPEEPAAAEAAPPKPVKPPAAKPEPIELPAAPVQNEFQPPLNPKHPEDDWPKAA